MAAGSQNLSRTECDASRLHVASNVFSVRYGNCSIAGYKEYNHRKIVQTIGLRAFLRFCWHLGARVCASDARFARILLNYSRGGMEKKWQRN